MAIPLGANGNTFSYPEESDTGWGTDSTNWASAVSAALGSIGLGASLTPNAILDLNSTSRGFLPPRMTTTQRDAIASPTIGLTVINTTLTTLDFYDGTAWQSLKITNSPNWTETDAAPTAAAVEGRINGKGFALLSGAIFTGNISSPNITGGTSITSPSVTGSTVTNTPKLKATTSGGINFEANGGTNIATMGAGGGNNATFEGGVNIKGAAAVGSGTESNPDLHKDGDTNTGIWFNAADEMTLVTNSTRRFRVDASGNFTSVVSGGSTLLPTFMCRAWVNFNGTLSTPITPRASGNVSSVTKNGTGDYTVNFTTAMPDANYSVIISSRFSTGTANGVTLQGMKGVAESASSVTVITTGIIGSSTGMLDVLSCYVAVFR